MEQRRFGSTDLSTSPIAETIGALQRLHADGKIRYYGVSNHDVPMLEECRGVGSIATNQLPFNGHGAPKPTKPT